MPNDSVYLKTRYGNWKGVLKVFNSDSLLLNDFSLRNKKGTETLYKVLFKSKNIPKAFERNPIV